MGGRPAHLDGAAQPSHVVGGRPKFGTVVARPVARSFKTVGIESYYGPMCDSTVPFEGPKREGGE
jgi:hypothetical protein